MKIRRSVLLFCLWFGMLLGQAAAARELVIGTISDEPVKETRSFLPFARHLAAELQVLGFTGGQVVIARDVGHMAQLLRKGEVDVYVDSPLVSLAVRAKCGSRLLARQWKRGIGLYHSVIFARRDSGIRSLQDLKGRVVAFEEAFSSSGYFLPWLEIRAQSVPLTALDGPRSQRPEGAAGYVFSGDDENTLEWVLRGLVDAGAMSLRGLKMRAGGDLGDLEILAETAAIPRHVVSVPPGAPEEFSSTLLTVLIGLDQSEAGRQALQSFEGTTKFDAIPDQTLDVLEQFQKPVSNLLGGS